MSQSINLDDFEMNLDELLEAAEPQPGDVAFDVAQPEDAPSGFTMASLREDAPSNYSMGSMEPLPINDEGSFPSSVARDVLEVLPYEDPPSPARAAAPQPPPPPVTVSSNIIGALPEALILRGRDIPTYMPGFMHFICGCAGFSPLHNAIFLQVVHAHFVERLQDPVFYEICGTRYPVRGEVAAIMEQARQVPGNQGVRIWTVVGKTRLRESNWMDLEFEDVTNNPVRRRERLEAPLRSILTRLYTNSTSSRTSRWPSATDREQPAASPPAAAAPDPPNNQLRRNHDELSGTISAGMWRHVAPTAAGPATLKVPPDTIRAPPETDRSWEMQDDWSGSIMYASAMATELCDSINKPHTYITSLRCIVNEQLPHQANSILAKKVAKTWLDEQPTSRWVCWIDASDSSTLCDSYRQLIRRLHVGNEYNLEPAAPQRRRLSAQAAASEFLNEFRTHFSPAHECLIVYENVTHPTIFSEGFLPPVWLQDSHCAKTIRGIILSTPHNMYDGNMGAPFGSVVQHSIEWISRFGEENQYWWERLPQSNLPPLWDDVEEPPGIDRILARDGRAVALVNPETESSDHTGNVANQVCRRWQMTDNDMRFSVWLNASSEQKLRDSYQAAIRRVTHSSPQCPLGNPTDLAIRTISNELMATLMKVRELSPAHQWIMVFAGNPPNDSFHGKFFSAATNWWNSRGRFIVTSSSSDTVEVELVVDDQAIRRQLVTVMCR
jgi:hypothetical protein